MSRRAVQLKGINFYGRIEFKSPIRNFIFSNSIDGRMREFLTFNLYYGVPDKHGK